MKFSPPPLRISALIAGIGVSIILLGIAIAAGNNIRDNSVTAAATYQTATVRRGVFEAAVTTTGTVSSVRDLTLSFQVNGVISNVVVSPGQSVKKDEVLAQLDTRELELQVGLAQSRLKEAQSKLELIKTTSARDLITAQANLRQAQAQLDKARTGNFTKPEVAAAKADLDKATAEYQKLTSVPNQNDITIAEANLKQAQAKLQELQKGPDGQALKKAEAQLEAAKQNFVKVKSERANAKEQARITRDQNQKVFDTAQAAYKKIYDQNRNPDGTLKANLSQSALEAEAKALSDLDKAKADLDRAKSELTNAENIEVAAVNEAQAQVTSAEADLEKLKAGPGAQAIASAQAEVDKAQAFLNKAREGPTRAQIAAAQAEMDKARANLDKVNIGGTDKDIAIAQAEVEKAQAVLDDLNRGPKAAELSQSQAGVDAADNLLKQAQLKLNQATMRAPFDGVISNVNMSAGQSVGFVAVGAATSNAGTLNMVDMRNLKVDLFVSEFEIARLKTSQNARITLDTLGKDRGLEGAISYISPKAGAQGYQVTVQLKSGSADKDPFALGVKPGMSGSVKLVVERKTETLVIPAKAVKKLGNDNVVEVVGKNGQLIVVPILPGGINESEVEILEPTLLRPSDQIVVGIAVQSKNIREDKDIIEFWATPTPVTGPGSKN